MKVAAKQATEAAAAAKAPPLGFAALDPNHVQAAQGSRFLAFRVIGMGALFRCQTFPLLYHYAKYLHIQLGAVRVLLRVLCDS